MANVTFLSEVTAAVLVATQIPLLEVITLAKLLLTQGRAEAAAQVGDIPTLPVLKDQKQQAAAEAAAAVEMLGTPAVQATPEVRLTQPRSTVSRFPPAVLTP